MHNSCFTAGGRSDVDLPSSSSAMPEQLPRSSQRSLGSCRRKGSQHRSKQQHDAPRCLSGDASTGSTGAGSGAGWSCSHAGTASRPAWHRHTLDRLSMMLLQQWGQARKVGGQWAVFLRLC